MNAGFIFCRCHSNKPRFWERVTHLTNLLITKTLFQKSLSNWHLTASITWQPVTEHLDGYTIANTSSQVVWNQIINRSEGEHSRWCGDSWFIRMSVIMLHTSTSRYSSGDDGGCGEAPGGRVVSVTLLDRSPGSFPSSLDLTTKKLDILKITIQSWFEQPQTRLWLCIYFLSTRTKRLRLRLPDSTDHHSPYFTRRVNFKPNIIDYVPLK